VNKVVAFVHTVTLLTGDVITTVETGDPEATVNATVEGAALVSEAKGVKHVKYITHSRSLICSFHSLFSVESTGALSNSRTTFRSAPSPHAPTLCLHAFLLEIIVVDTVEGHRHRRTLPLSCRCVCVSSRSLCRHPHSLLHPLLRRCRPCTSPRRVSITLARLAELV
jgi:hypothetical protein